MVDKYLKELVIEIRESFNIPKNDIEFNRNAGEQVLKTVLQQYIADKYVKMAFDSIVKFLPLITSNQLVGMSPGIPAVVSGSSYTTLPSSIPSVDYEIDWFWRAGIDDIEEIGNEL